MSEANRDESMGQNAANDDEPNTLLSNFDWALGNDDEEQSGSHGHDKSHDRDRDDDAPTLVSSHEWPLASPSSPSAATPASAAPPAAEESPTTPLAQTDRDQGNLDQENPTEAVSQTSLLPQSDAAPTQVISDAPTIAADPIGATTPLPVNATPRRTTPIEGSYIADSPEMMPPAIPPEDVDESGIGGPASNGGEAGGKGKNHKRNVIIAVVVAIIAVAGLSVAGIMWWNARSHDEALKACTESAQEFQAAKAKWDKAVEQSAEAAKITEDQVADASTVTSLKDALAGTVPTVGECSATASAQELRQVAASAKTSADQLGDSADAVSQLAQKVTDSQAKKATDEAASGLQQAIDSAKELLNSEGAQQIEQSITQALQSAVDAANETLSQGKSAELLQNATSVLNAAVQKVKEAISAFQLSPAVLAAQYCPAAAGDYLSDPSTGAEAVALFGVEGKCEFMQQGQYYTFVKDSMKKNDDGSVTWSVAFDADRSQSDDGSDGFGYTTATLYPPQVSGAGEAANSTQYYRLAMNSTRFGAVVGWKSGQ
jgi:flagellar basal body-associated protein FliL